MPRSSRKTKSHAHFPSRLHDLMAFIEAKRLDSSVIGWVLSGRGFIIYDTTKLMEILPLFFGQTKYKSFLRQLNMWNFERCSNGPNRGTYMHPYFVKGNRDLCDLMIRQNKKFDTVIRGAAVGSRQRAKISGNSNMLANYIDITGKFSSTQDFEYFKKSKIPPPPCTHLQQQQQYLQQNQHEKQEVSSVQQKQTWQEDQYYTYHASCKSHPHEILSERSMEAIAGSGSHNGAAMSRNHDSFVSSPYPCAVLGSVDTTPSRKYCISSLSANGSVWNFPSLRCASTCLPKCLSPNNWRSSPQGSLFVLEDDLEPSPMGSPSSSSSSSSFLLAPTMQLQEILNGVDDNNNFKEEEGSENETSSSIRKQQEMALASSLCPPQTLNACDIDETRSATYNITTGGINNNIFLVNNDGKSDAHSSLATIKSMFSLKQEYYGSVGNDDNDDDLSCFAGKQFFMVDCLEQ